VTSVRDFTVLAVLVGAVACKADGDVASVSAAPPSPSFEAFERTIFREPGTGVYVVDGDTAIESRSKLRAAYERFQNRAFAGEENALIVQNVDGRDAKWDDVAKLQVTYCVSGAFGGNQAAVAAAMASAASAWEAVANVHFGHVEAEDVNCTADNTNVVFDVNPVDHNQYFARSFFPDSSRAARSLLIDKSSFGTTLPPQLTLEGIVRHELGHVLGFRHEHIRPEAHTADTPAICFEDGNWRPLTAYDWHSVMHYPDCNGTGEWTFYLSDDDKIGVRELYGPPLTDRE
jgi:hypothetical protein